MNGPSCWLLAKHSVDDDADVFLGQTISTIFLRFESIGNDGSSSDVFFSF